MLFHPEAPATCVAHLSRRKKILLLGLVVANSGVYAFPQSFAVSRSSRSLASWLVAPASTSSMDGPATIDSTNQEDTHTTSFFTTPPMQVYIEDTDAYGIMYNSNYLRSFDRALHMTTTAITATRHDNDNDDSVAATVCDKTNLRGQHEGWSIVSVREQRFARSPVLGQDFIIQGRLQTSDATEEVWDMEMTSLDGLIVYNSVKDLTIQVADYKEDDAEIMTTTTHAPLHSSLMNIPTFDMDGIQPNFVCQDDCFTIYRDEIDAHWQGHLPLRNVLNLFERSRTNALGGPEGLRRLQEDQDNAVVIVVTGISNLTLVEEGTSLVPGQTVAVETAMVVKKRGMIIECYQTLKSDNNDGTSRRLAQGKVTLMLLSAKTRRPTTKSPAWLRELLQVETTST